MRKKILKIAEKMEKNCIGEGNNPYSVNVVTFSGHGFTYDGDAIAVIPEIKEEKGDEDEVQARFINMSGLARKFAFRKGTINIFMMSMCRFSLDQVKIKEIEKSIKGEEEGSQAFIYNFLHGDALQIDSKCIGYSQEGLSYMIFGC